MAEFIFSNQSRIFPISPHLLKVVGAQKDEIIECYFDFAWSIWLVELVHRVEPDLSEEEAHEAANKLTKIWAQISEVPENEIKFYENHRNRLRWAIMFPDHVTEVFKLFREIDSYKKLLKTVHKRELEPQKKFEVKALSASITLAYQIISTYFAWLLADLLALFYVAPLHTQKGKRYEYIDGFFDVVLRRWLHKLYDLCNVEPSVVEIQCYMGQELILRAREELDKLKKLIEDLKKEGFAK